MHSEFSTALGVVLLGLFWTSDSFSSCDDVDITFLIDTDSIMNSGDSVSDFITSIIWEGSSEYAGFSAILYGDNIPINQDIVIFNLEETQSIHQRQKEEAAIANKLESIFDDIINVAAGDNVKSISLSKAFDIVSKQNKPLRNENKKEKLDDLGVGIRDDEDEYFVFDYYNKLVPDPKEIKEIKDGDQKPYDDICSLLHYNKENDDQTLHFLMGQKINKLFIECNGRDVLLDELLEKQMFFNFNDDLLDNKMEIIYDITCPAIINSDCGTMDLGNHNQWIDPDTILKCNLNVIDEGSVDKPIKLDENSYILVRDNINDDNTFKVGDYLIASPNVGKIIQELGCWSRIYKISDITPVKDNDKTDEYETLKLSVSMPKSPTEYILKSNAIGHNHPVYNEAKDGEDFDPKRALLSFLKLEGSGSATFFDTDDYPGVFDNEWTYSKTGTKEVSYGTKPKFTFTGTGTVTLQAGYDIDLQIYLDFEFIWDVLSNDIYIKVIVNIDWGLTAYFNAELVGQIVAQIDNLINYSKYITFSIGPVPVIIKPFITLNAKLTSIPLRVYSGISCHYGELLQVGYKYNKKTTFHAQYGTIRTNSRYTLPLVKQWLDVEREDCVRVNYEYGAGAGLSCVWFDYNANSKKCRCFGAGTMMGDITSESGTTAYIMNKNCASEYWNKCDGCGSDIWVKEDGNSYSCDSLCCCKGSWPFKYPYTCSTTCHCVPGWYHWYCRSCPVLQSNSGYETKAVTQGPIKSRTAHSDNGCTKTFEIGSEEENEADCPVTQLGFDIEVEARIGANLYSMITVYGKALLTIPFRITMPEFNNAICSNAADSCENTLQVSFTIGMDLALSMIYAVDFGDLGAVIEAAVEGSEPAIGDVSAILGTEVAIGSWEILPTTPLGCVSLSGVLSPLDAYYKSKCCP